MLRFDFTFYDVLISSLNLTYTKRLLIPLVDLPLYLFMQKITVLIWFPFYFDTALFLEAQTKIVLIFHLKENCLIIFQI